MQMETDGRAVIVERPPGCASFTRTTGTGEEWRMPATIDDPAILDEITGAFRTVGYPAGGG